MHHSYVVQCLCCVAPVSIADVLFLLVAHDTKARKQVLYHVFILPQRWVHVRQVDKILYGRRPLTPCLCRMATKEERTKVQFVEARRNQRVQRAENEVLKL